MNASDSSGNISSGSENVPTVLSVTAGVWAAAGLVFFFFLVGLVFLGGIFFFFLSLASPILAFVVFNFPSHTFS